MLFMLYKMSAKSNKFVFFCLLKVMITREGISTEQKILKRWRKRKLSYYLPHTVFFVRQSASAEPLTPTFSSSVPAELTD